MWWFPDGSMSKASFCNAGAAGDSGWPLGGEEPLEEGMATHSRVPKKSHGQRSLAGYIVHGVAKSWMWLSMHVPSEVEGKMKAWRKQIYYWR